jgi:hypothetical protein
MARQISTALLAMLLALLPAAARSMDPSPDRFAGYAVNNARLLGLTPEGTALWAKHIHHVGQWREWQRVTEIEAEIGRELTFKDVDWRLLERLASEYGTELGKAAGARRQRTVDTALQLTRKDRRAIGAFLKRKSQRRSEAPILLPSPPHAVSDIAFNFYRPFGLSAEGFELLIETAREERASDLGRFELSTEIGEQLSRDEPDPRQLNDLVARFAAEETRLATIEKRRLIRVAGRLTVDDRQRFGRSLAGTATGSLNDGKPVLEIVP